MEASQSGAPAQPTPAAAPAVPDRVEGSPEGAAPGTPEAQTPENQGVNAQAAAAAHAAEQAQGGTEPEGAPRPGEEGYDPAEEREGNVIEGDQGRAALEQDAAIIGRDEATGAVRTSAPPATSQSGVPLSEDRAAGVRPGDGTEGAPPAQPAE